MTDLVFSPAPASTDLLALFTESHRWAAARAVLTGFQLFAQQILYDGEDLNGPEPGGYADTGIAGVGPNVWPALVEVDAVRWLQAHELPLRIEIGGVKPGHVGAIDGTHNLAAAQVALERVERAGGRIAEFAIDEPLHAGLHLIAPALSLEQAAAYTADNFIHQLRPRVDRILLIEPYPACSVAEISAFWQALVRFGAEPAGLVLDVDFWAIRNAGRNAQQRWPADIIELGRVCAPTPISIIAWGHDHRTDGEYCAEVLNGVRTCLAHGVIPQEFVIESWSARSGSSKKELPRNLGQHDSGSHTWLVRQIAALVNA